MVALNRVDEFRRRLERYILCEGAQKVATRVEVSRRTVYKWLHGTKPKGQRRRTLEAAIERHEARRVASR